MRFIVLPCVILGVFSEYLAERQVCCPGKGYQLKPNSTLRPLHLDVGRLDLRIVSS
jgi:hypothetical protein